MRIIDLYYLQKIVHFSSITAAAQELNISQQRLSHIIQSVEEELGITIFNRNKKGTSLTIEGSEFMKHVQQILNTYQDMLDIKQHPALLPHFTLGIDRHITSELLDTVLNICSDFSEFEFSILQKNSVFELIDALDNETIHLALSVSADISTSDYLYTKASKNAIKCHILAPATIDILLHKNNPLIEKNDIKFEDIFLYPMVFDTRDSTYRHLLHMQKHINIFLESDSTELKLSCINHNFAVGIMDSVTISHIDFEKQYPNIRRISFPEIQNIGTTLFLFEKTSCMFPKYTELVRQIKRAVSIYFKNK